MTLVYNDLSQWISYESKLQLRVLKDLVEKELDPTSDQKLRGKKVIGKRVKRKIVKTERKESLKLFIFSCVTGLCREKTETKH